MFPKVTRIGTRAHSALINKNLPTREIFYVRKNVVSIFIDLAVIHPILLVGIIPIYRS